MPNAGYKPKRTENYVSLSETLRNNAYRDGCSMQSALRDVITDLRHICDEGGYNFDEALVGSIEVYLIEHPQKSKEALYDTLRKYEPSTSEKPSYEEILEKLREVTGVLMDTNREDSYDESIGHVVTEAQDLISRSEEVSNG